MRSRDSFDAARIGNEWRDIAVFAHDANGWTAFDDDTGYLGMLPGEGPAGDFMAARSEDD
jgi:hypothetical protein